MNDIEAEIDAAYGSAFGVGPMPTGSREWFALGYRSALARATRGEGATDNCRDDAERAIVRGTVRDALERARDARPTPPPATIVAGPAIRAMDAVLDKIRCTPPPATGEAEPDPRGEDREAVEAARGEQAQRDAADARAYRWLLEAAKIPANREAPFGKVLADLGCDEPAGEARIMYFTATGGPYPLPTKRAERG